MSQSNLPQDRDEELWALARKRSNFKKSLMVYVIINIFLWLLWYFTNHNHSNYGLLPWPAWVTLGWGLGIVFSYIDAYHSNKSNSVQKEYDKLKNENK